MTDRSKFEQMLEHLVNEDQEAAKEIFHQIVVEKSREIYETILAEDFELEAKEEDEEEVEEAKEEDEEEVEEAKEEDEEEVEEDFAFDEADDEDDDGPVGGDPTDDMLRDIDSEEGENEPEFDDEEESDDLEDRVLDLEDAMDELRAQFEKELGGGMGGDDMSMGGDDMSMGGDDMEKPDMKMSMADDVSFMREYVEKVGGATYDKFGKMGDNGANTKSPVAGKNDMGGTTANILSGRNGSDAGEAGTAGGQLKGNGVLKGKPQDMNTGNINVPGGNAGKTAFKKKEPGHGAEKKGAAEQAENKKSIIGGKK